MAPVFVALTLSGCFSRSSTEERCAGKVEEYQASGSVPGIVIPPGLSAPASGQTFQVPGTGDTRAPPDAGCLSRPPAFFRREPAPESVPAG
ncbi:MAG: hypothetical protein KJ041_04130 [Gammaproteobacteria bacterium]|nr:hypothetical protein [Gammaproteobacteria bacterium]